MATDHGCAAFKKRMLPDSPLPTVTVFSKRMIAARFTRQTILGALCFVASVNLMFAVVAPFCPTAHFYLHLFCNQNPSRSFILGPYTCGLCARCTGIYSGIIVAFVLSQVKAIRCTWTCFTLLSIVFAFISVVLKLAKVDVSNFPRFLFGICLGVTVFVGTSFLAAQFVTAFTSFLLFLERRLSRRKAG
jgi:uncharacterized membrane protein